MCKPCPTLFCAAVLLLAPKLVAQTADATQVKLQYYNHFVPQPHQYERDGTYKHFIKSGETDTAAMVAMSEALARIDSKPGVISHAPKQDIRGALEWLDKALSTSMKWVRSESQEDGYIGYRFLGQGAPAVVPNPVQAEKWLRLGVEGDDAASCYDLGVAYLRGDVLPRNNAEGMKLVLQAADRGDAHATLALAELYAEGKVVPQDLALAKSFAEAYPALAESQEESYRQEVADNQAEIDHLHQMDVEAHAEMMGVIAQGLNNIATTLSTPTAIQTARDQSLANINAAAAHGQPAAPTLTVEQSRKELKNAVNQAQKQQAASVSAPTANTGTVAPPVAYVPPASTGGTVVSAICPASGFVPGLMIQNGDTAQGVQCTPGQPISSTPSANAGSAPTTGAGAAPGITTTPVLTNCLLQSFVDGDLTVTNGCNVPVYATWWVNGHFGSWTLNPGEHTGTGYTSSDVAVGGASYYVCPKNASPADSSGHNLTGPASSYVCVVRY